MLKIALLAGLCFVASGHSPKPAHLHYELRVDAANLTGIAVEMQIRNAPASLQLAAHAHPEYDDKYWRYVSDIRAVDAKGVVLSVTPMDSVRWRIGNTTGDVNIQYRVRFPVEPEARSSWKPFLTPTGGLIGGPHSFLYVVGEEAAVSTITLTLPSGWKVGTGLNGPSTSREFKALDVYTLMESPMLVGRLREWSFRVNNIPHRVFYWPKPNATPFDTTAFVQGIEKVAAGAIKLFGAAPYEHFTFLMQDGAYSGGLEHPNSVTLGAQSADLAKNPNVTMPETAHEFFHTWNLMAIKPVEYREVDYRIAPQVAELWFSEGLTMFYADLLMRRAGLAAEDSTRIAHLEHLIARYLNMPGNARFSAEAISRAEYNASEGALGDYTASPHLQGELLGAMLDFRMRGATNGTHTIDDAMRLMYQRFGKAKFGNGDVEKVVQDACGCRVNDIFDRYVRNAGSINFQEFLSPLGLNVAVSWIPAVDDDGKRSRDLSIWATTSGPGNALRLRVSNPTGAWGKAGLHTGDQLVSANGKAMKTWSEFRQFLGGLALGDSVTITVNRAGKPITARVTVTGYEVPRVRIAPVAQASETQRHLQSAWMQGR